MMPFSRLWGVPVGTAATLLPFWTPWFRAWVMFMTLNHHIAGDTELGAAHRRREGAYCGGHRAFRKSARLPPQPWGAGCRGDDYHDRLGSGLAYLKVRDYRGSDAQPGHHYGAN